MSTRDRAQFLGPTALEKLPDAFIKIQRRKFKLTLYKRAGREFDIQPWVCRIAVGAIKFDTPAKPYLVLGKESPPTYTAPNSQWALDAGFKPGEKLPHDHPANPLRGAFLWLDDHGIGIHGTPNLLSLGTRASHGCIRVSEEDAIYLYNNVPLGTNVLVI